MPQPSKALIFAALLATFIPVTNCWPELAFEDPSTFQVVKPFFISPSPSANQVAVVSSFAGSLFRLSDGEWTGPFNFNFGFHDRSRDRSTARPWPMFTWVQEEDGTEIFMVNIETSEGVKIAGDSAVRAQPSSGEPLGPVEPETGRLIYTLYNKTGGPDLSLLDALDEVGFFSRNEVVSRESLTGIPPRVHQLQDISPQGDSVLCNLGMNDPLKRLDLTTGATTSFPVHDRPRISPNQISGRFSPDGEHILIAYSYGHLDYNQGSHLQVFTKNGIFVEELISYAEELRGFNWLRNGWIVYGLDGEVVLRKVVVSR